RVRIQHTVRALRRIKVGVVDERLPPDRERQDDGTVAAFGRHRGEQLDELWRQHVNETFAAVRDERVPVHEAPDSVWEGVGDAGDPHAAVAVADENNVPEVVHYHVVAIEPIASVNPTVFASLAPLPLMVGVKTLWLAASINTATGANSLPVCQAP